MEDIKEALRQLLGPSNIAGEWLTNEEAAAFTKYSVDYLSRCGDFVRGVHFTGDGRNRRWNRNWLDYWLMDRDDMAAHYRRIAASSGDR